MVWIIGIIIVIEDFDMDRIWYVEDLWLILIRLS